jgi:sporulation protein YlmC with PRC-barrel domain
MRKFTILFSMFLVMGMLLSACGASQTDNGNVNGNVNANTNLNSNEVIPATDVVAVTETAQVTASPYPMNDNGNLNANTNTNGNENLNANDNANLNGNVNETPMATQVVETPAALPGTGATDFHLVSNLMGMKVYSQACEDLGEVNNVILDMGGTSASYIVVGLGGFLGLGERNVPVPFSAVQFQGMTGGAAVDMAANANLNANTNDTNANANLNTNDANANLNANGNATGAMGACDTDGLVLLVSADQIKNAPEVDLGTLSGSGFMTEGWGADYNTYWTGLGFTFSGTGASDMGAPMATLAVTGTVVAPAVTATVAPITGTQTMTGTSAITGTTGLEAGTMGASLRGVVLADEFIGANVYSGAGDKLGEIQDVIIDLPSGKVLYALVDVNADLDVNVDGAGANANANMNTNDANANGNMNTNDANANLNANDANANGGVNVTGTASRLVPVPIQAFGWDAANEHFILVVDAQVLMSAPAIQDGVMPDFSAGWDSDYQFYWQPYTPTGGF